LSANLKTIFRPVPWLVATASSFEETDYDGYKDELNYEDFPGLTTETARR